MSLREQWNAARVQRQQEILVRQQQILEQRYETQIKLEEIAAHRVEMAAEVSQALQDFYANLKADIAAFREETRSQQEQIWIAEKQQRSAYVTNLQAYVWGTAPTPIKPRPKPGAVSLNSPKR
ncbi:hypothetical protein [Oscillatoria acuminata]|uniref:Gas vesicle protein GvpC n=1 Tax=Oscillatoria acuminata PCC 6304 TaxID=56110 RepID=K9TBJ4_9CYAN|nr:hypothetical protein [Oscillatoria acuminata]AFY79910.1 hypothetical protein Oscil6304_0155 [Oscillatoria acuminata PCC 6304]